VNEEQKKMIEGIISFRDQQVSQIMTPRTDVIAVDVNAPLGEVRDKILKEGLSRVPVFEGTLDNIVGILYAKDLLKFLDTANVGAEAEPPKVKIEVRKIMRPPLFVPPTKPLHDLLREFRIQQVHMAVVLDEYGGTSGLVTTEDILEEIVGDIADEYERPEALELKHIDDHTVEVDARMNIAELNRELGLALPEDEDYQTIGGFVISTLGAIPPKGERLVHEGLGVVVIDSEPRRVKKVRLELPERDAAATGGDGGAENVSARA
jgi:CBS domain containing-hemolysin-like protein